MKAYKFRAIIDDRDRIKIPIANIKVLNRLINKETRDWEGSVIELTIDSIRFVDGSKINFNTII